MKQELTYEEATQLADLQAEIDRGEYASDRIPLTIAWGIKPGQERAYTIWDAIARAEAWMRQDREQTMGGWG